MTDELAPVLFGRERLLLVVGVLRGGLVLGRGARCGPGNRGAGVPLVDDPAGWQPVVGGARGVDGDPRARPLAMVAVPDPDLLGERLGKRSGFRAEGVRSELHRCVADGPNGEVSEAAALDHGQTRPLVSNDSVQFSTTPVDASTRTVPSALSSGAKSAGRPSSNRRAISSPRNCRTRSACSPTPHRDEPADLGRPGDQMTGLAGKGDRAGDPAHPQRHRDRAAGSELCQPGRRDVPRAVTMIRSNGAPAAYPASPSTSAALYPPDLLSCARSCCMEVGSQRSCRRACG